MSVDTYLEGKDTRAYTRVQHGDVAVLVAPAIARWSGRVSLAAKRRVVGRGLAVALEHAHGPACQH